MAEDNIVKSFPLTTRQVFRQYTRIPPEASNIFYHYTTHAGLVGILRTGGLRATYRKMMNDTGEFEYARKIIYKALDEVEKRNDLPSVAVSLTEYTRINLQRFLENTTNMSSSFCSCLTVSPDHTEQWKTYAEDGNGFAIGLNMAIFMKNQRASIQAGQHYIYCLPVLYNESIQLSFVHSLVESGVRDLQGFADKISNRAADLTSLRDEITKEIVTCLLVLIDFIKSEMYSSEKEIRLVLDANDGTLAPSRVQHYKSGNKSIPFVFLDLRSPITNRLPLAEIKVGPNASFANEKRFIKDLLNDLGYGSNYDDWPQISISLV